jgi:two-component sensor histidine kinase
MVEHGENIGPLELARPQRKWARWLPAFFAVWTVLAALAVWWLLTDGVLKSGVVFRYDGVGARPLSIRMREWLGLALVNFHWAVGWVLLAPYVIWISRRFYLEQQRWLWHGLILIASAAAFIFACDALDQRMGITQDVMIIVARKTISDDVQIDVSGETNQSAMRRKFFTSFIAKSNVVAELPATEGGGIGPEQGGDPSIVNLPQLHRQIEEVEMSLSGSGATNRLHFSQRVATHRRRPTVFFALDGAAWLALAGLAHAFHFHRRFRERELQTGLLSARLTEARLRALRNQLQPHFLFNALNGIATLVRRDPPAAHEMLTSLSELLRLTLSQCERQEISLREEIDFLDRYLEIQRMRFGDRLAVRKEIDPATLDCAVPPLVLQPLVENAIRHGIEPLGSPGCVRIEARREADELVLLVEDDGVGMEPLEAGRPVNGHGVGLASIRERLVSLYGERGQVVLRGKTGSGSGVQAEVRLPFHPVRVEAQNMVA